MKQKELVQVADLEATGQSMEIEKGGIRYVVGPHLGLYVFGRAQAASDGQEFIEAEGACCSMSAATKAARKILEKKSSAAR